MSERSKAESFRPKLMDMVSKVLAGRTVKREQDEIIDAIELALEPSAHEVGEEGERDGRSS